ncbi:MOSC domain-containing protein [Oceanirhabdus sp. W0125-5]|uniref:MOSC domain-containing protein n=1 Tax=Oceanirhabdus sp. W0125-5 TaxID=2999116 RepID=UPI0022F2D75C|nr:MOSC domain-containing protein [Oceanirhabdus sp. W0125-5]WBW99508.1 MOSC domain-containing protein [Oceanirhabdus sp. W0125-5]
MAKVRLIKIKRSKELPRDIVNEVYFEENKGLKGDIYADGGNRQISIFGTDSKRIIQENKDHGLCTVKFEENITIDGIELYKYPVGTKIRIGDAILEITQVGKECFKGCSIYEVSNKCLLTTECIFGKVNKSGWVKNGDKIDIIYK